MASSEKKKRIPRKTSAKRKQDRQPYQNDLLNRGDPDYDVSEISDSGLDFGYDAKF